jgi:CubicO group peptidase (beta-lactamase class C family)
MHDYVPGWPEKRWPVTARLLLAHLGGVRHYRRGEGESTVHYADQTVALARFAEDPLLHEPGTKYLYSTYGYNLAAAAVEQAAGKTFPQVVRELVAEPSGAMSLQDDDVRRIIKGRAAGYVRRDGELSNSELMDPSYKLGGGGLCSSAPDLVRFAQHLMAGKLVSKETLETMWTAQRTKDGGVTTYGLGFGVGERNGERVISHGGAQARVSTMLLMLPQHRIAVAVLCNLEGMRLGGPAREVAFALLAAELGR